MTEGFVFYRSFYEAIKSMPDREAKSMLCMICEYALNEKEPDEGAGLTEKAIFALIKPQIDANNRRKRNGRMGGGEYNNIRLTETEMDRLKADFGGDADEAIQYLSAYKAEKGYKTKSDYLTIRRWVIDAVRRQPAIRGSPAAAVPTQYF